MSKLNETINPQIQEAQGTLNTRNMKNIPRKIIIRLLKSIKEKISKACRREVHAIYRGIRNYIGFLTRNKASKKSGAVAIKYRKEKAVYLLNRITHSGKNIFHQQR